MKTIINQIIDIFKQYPNYFYINKSFIHEKINNNIVFSNNGISSNLFLEFENEIFNFNSPKYDFFYTNSYSIMINYNSELKNIIEKVEDFIKEYERRYNLYLYFKYQKAIEEL